MGGGRTYRYTLADFGRFCSSLTTDKGSSLRLHAYERRILSAHFGEAIESVVVIPKKNGKTTLLAALALFHLYVIPNADVLMVASSRDQAKRMYEQAAELVRFSWLRDHFEIKTGYNYIWPNGGDSAGAKIAVKPAEAGTVDGVEPTLALVDELHRHRSLSLYTVIRRGLIPGIGRMVTISTAGAGHDNPLGMIRERVYKLDVHRKGAERWASDGGFHWREWALEDDDDLSDMRLVKRANPAPWHTIASLRRDYSSPSNTPQEWARLACGIWTFGAEPWITAEAWDRLAVDIGGIEAGDEVVAHVSAGSGGCAVVVAAEKGGAVGARAAILTGDVPLEAVERLCLQVTETYQVREFSYDRVEFQRSAELLEQRGIPMIETPHSAERLSIASATLNRYVRAGQLFHDGDKAFRSQVLSGTTKDTQRGWHIVKTPNTRALVALAFAVNQATQVPSEPPEFIAL